MEEELKVFFNLERDINHFVVCRVNCVDEIEVLKRVPIAEPFDEIKRKLKQVKSECIQQEMEDRGIVAQYEQERIGNFAYKRPRTVKENLKLKEDRQIRKQQEEEFFKACQPKQEQKR